MGGQSGTGNGTGAEEGKDADALGGAFGLFDGEGEDDDEGGHENEGSEPETVIDEDKDWVSCTGKKGNKKKRTPKENRD